MKSSWIGAVSVAAALIAAAAGPAYAWGPKAQQAITLTSLQLLRQRQADVLQTAQVRLDADVVKGSEQGWESLDPPLTLGTDARAMEAIDAEIQLLRGVRKYGMGSYFAYRMGVLSSLVADAMLPLALEQSPEAQRHRQQIEADIDARLDRYSFMPTRPKQVYIRTASEYFRTYRAFYADNRRMIVNDYDRGVGYQGLLSEAGPVIFGRAVESVADAWHTVLATTPLDVDVDPSPQALTWYFVNAIRYLLYEKDNYQQAVQTYDILERVNPGIPDAYIVLGDLFYQYGTGEAVERGVREWKIAQRIPGAHRQETAAKLAKHYIAAGQAFLETGVLPSSPETDLQNALKNFSLALEYQSTNAEAAERINAANAALVTRQKNHEMATQYLSSAETVVQKAEQSRLMEDFASAIATYNNASSVYALVLENPDYQFPELVAAAQRGVANVKKSIRDVLKQVLENAHLAIETGDRAVDEREYQRAIDSYGMVQSILTVIPEDQSSQAAEKQGLLTTAEERIEKAKREKTEWEALQQQQQQQEQANQ